MSGRSFSTSKAPRCNRPNVLKEKDHQKRYIMVFTEEIVHVRFYLGSITIPYTSSSYMFLERNEPQSTLHYEKVNVL
jgi:hypothetical protein